MGISILSGILSTTSIPPITCCHTPSSMPVRFIACVQSAQTATRIQTSLSQHLSSVTILTNDNIRGIDEAEIVLLACNVVALTGVLEAPGVRLALQGKLLISILAGITVEPLQEVEYGPRETAAADNFSTPHCQFISAIPNIAASIHASVTVITQPSNPLSEQNQAVVRFLLSHIGDIEFVTPRDMDAATLLCGAGLVFAALFMEAMALSAEKLGIPSKAAVEMAARIVRGSVELILVGDDPASLRERVSTKGGVTAE
ncbi:MAG: delta 1-pyrroline-5-carboxylate reductase [Icmadophila ericetorum]|nr:delta 1-pyrroline-5-carboxylate reductase [Icmadophila ericetorum]